MRDALVVGLGLIGGAVGRALRRRGWRVRYIDPRVALEEARRAEAADERVETVSVGDELVLIATPVDIAIDIVRTIEISGVVTSVCGVMRPLREAARGAFVAGHPMTGWHEGGLGNAHHVALDGAPWFLDADEPRVEELVRECGAVPVRVDAARHDAAVALTSHLPQILSTALFAYLREQPDVAEFAGSGLRSFRLAASGGEMWQSLIDVNRENLRPHAEAIAQLMRAIIEGDERDAFAKAQALWRELQG